MKKDNLSLYSLTIGVYNHFEGETYWEASVEVPDTLSLYQLHRFIQHILEFDNDHLFEFYAGRNEGNRKILFSNEPGYPHDGGDYEDILLCDIYPLKGLKLYYLFDFGDSWLFEIRKSRKKAVPVAGTVYPRVVSETGDKPVQYDYDEN